MIIKFKWFRRDATMAIVEIDRSRATCIKSWAKLMPSSAITIDGKPYVLRRDMSLRKFGYDVVFAAGAVLPFTSLQVPLTAPPKWWNLYGRMCLLIVYTGAKWLRVRVL